MYFNSDLKLIENKKQRDVTLSKRKRIFMKKAIELSVLCDLNICLFIQDNSSRNRVTHYMSDPKMDINEFFNQN